MSKIEEIRAIWRGMPVDVHIDEDGDLSTNDEDGDGEPFGSLAGNEDVNKVFCRARADVFHLLGEVERLRVELEAIGGKALTPGAGPLDIVRMVREALGKDRMFADPAAENERLRAEVERLTRERDEAASRAESLLERVEAFELASRCEECGGVGEVSADIGILDATAYCTDCGGSGKLVDCLRRALARCDASRPSMTDAEICELFVSLGDEAEANGAADEQAIMAAALRGVFLAGGGAP